MKYWFLIKWDVESKLLLWIWRDWHSCDEWLFGVKFLFIVWRWIEMMLTSWAVQSLRMPVSRSDVKQQRAASCDEARLHEPAQPQHYLPRGGGLLPGGPGGLLDRLEPAGSGSSGRRRYSTRGSKNKFPMKNAHFKELYWGNNGNFFFDTPYLWTVQIYITK